MSALVVEAHVTPHQLLRAVAQLTGPELDAFTHAVLSLRAQRVAPSVDAQEGELLDRLSRCHLEPTAAARLTQLQAQRAEERLTDAEHAELIVLTQEAERLNVERVQALAALARQRGVSLDALLETLGLG